MYLIKKEIFGQYGALEKTYEYFFDKAEDIINIKRKFFFDKLTFIGSGSSYCLSKSGEITTKIHLALPANSLPAGDLLLNFSHYHNLIDKTLLVALSRSGSTSEVVLAVKRAKKEHDVPCISICAREKSELSEIVDLSLEIPWAFDESICQTQTVTNLYMSIMLLIAILADNDKLTKEIKEAINNGENFISEYTDILKEFAQSRVWDKTVVLADSELEGIASEGALAFKEIACSPANYHHLLDVRHGPMVLIDSKTLIIIATSPFELSYQTDLIKDLKEEGSTIITVGSEDESKLNSDLHVTIPDYYFYGVRGIPFIFIPQAIAYFKAISVGINPDVPQGLDPWIKL